MLAEKFKCIPEGMLPMCYPADQYDGNFIPNWAMWFVIELGDYLKRTGDQEFVSLLHDKVYALLDYFVPFENEYGLLEKLENWVFVEWSKANELVQDVNFPTNMLYAATLKTAGELYHDSALIEKSAYLADVIRNRSFDGPILLIMNFAPKTVCVQRGKGQKLVSTMPFSLILPSRSSIRNCGGC